MFHANLLIFFFMSFFNDSFFTLAGPPNIIVFGPCCFCIPHPSLFSRWGVEVYLICTAFLFLWNASCTVWDWQVLEGREGWPALTPFWSRRRGSVGISVSVWFVCSLIHILQFKIRSFICWLKSVNHTCSMLFAKPWCTSRTVGKLSPVHHKCILTWAYLWSFISMTLESMLSALKCSLRPCFPWCYPQAPWQHLKYLSAVVLLTARAWVWSQHWWQAMIRHQNKDWHLHLRSSKLSYGLLHHLCLSSLLSLGAKSTLNKYVETS